MLATEQVEAKILAISGVGEMLLAVLCEGSRARNFQVHTQGLRHNEHIVSLCEALCSQEGALHVSQLGLNAIAVDLGPGSFTGQRISMSFAKGVSAALGKPLLGFSSFELWLELFCNGESDRCNVAESPVLVLIDGRKRRFYANLYAAGASVGQWDLSSRELIVRISEQWGEDFIRNLRLSGPSAALFLEELASLASKDELVGFPLRAFEAWQSCNFVPPPSFAAIAAELAHLADREYSMQNFLQCSEGPLYLRKSDAEEELKKQV